MALGCMRRVEVRIAHPQSLIVVLLLLLFLFSLLLLLTICQRDAMSWRAERTSEAGVLRPSSRTMREWWATNVCEMNRDNNSVTVDTCRRGSRDGVVVLKLRSLLLLMPPSVAGGPAKAMGLTA